MRLRIDYFEGYELLTQTDLIIRQLFSPSIIIGLKPASPASGNSTQNARIHAYYWSITTWYTECLSSPHPGWLGTVHPGETGCRGGGEVHLHMNPDQLIIFPWNASLIDQWLRHYLHHYTKTIEMTQSILIREPIEIGQFILLYSVVFI